MQNVVQKVLLLLLIALDCDQLITTKEPITFGLRGGPATVHKALGWVLHGSAGLILPHEC